MTGYILCDYSKIKEEFPEFRATLDMTRSNVISRASSAWGIPVEMFTLEKGHVTTIIPALFADMNGTRLSTWNQTFTATGHQTIMTGVGTGNMIPGDYKVGLVGIAFLDKAIRVAEIRMQISDKKFPRINLEEAFAYEYPTIVFEEGYMLDEKTSFELYAYVLSQGPQRIKLLGVQANRVKDKLIATEVGAAATL